MRDPETLKEKMETFIINAVFERICKLLNCHWHRKAQRQIINDSDEYS